MGELEGPGMIESDVPRVVAHRDRGFLIFGTGFSGGYTVSHFGPEGQFRNALGRSGTGPGELSDIVDVAFAGDDQIVVLDSRRRTFITFRESGPVVSEVRLEGVQTGRFRIINGDTIGVIAVMDRRPESVGLPLHLVDLRTGDVLRRFGSTGGSWSLSTPYALAVNISETSVPEQAVWWGSVGRPHLEKWSLEGEHRTTITGDLNWFPGDVRGGGSDRTKPPPAAILQFSVDGLDRLWMLTAVPGRRWREVRPEGPEGVITPEQARLFRDVRLDVFDLEARRHLGYHVWDTRNITLVEMSGTVLVSRVEDTTPSWPRVVLYDVHFSGTVSPRRRR
jgi:hypothetical protein